MREKRLPINWKTFQETLVDSAKMSSNEIKRGLDEAKNHMIKYNLIKKRKDLFAELGRSLYEANEDNLPDDVAKFIKSTELHEIINEIKDIDFSIVKINERKNV